MRRVSGRCGVRDNSSFLILLNICLKGDWRCRLPEDSMNWLVRVLYEDGVWSVIDGLEKTGPFSSQALAITAAVIKAYIAQGNGAQPRIEIMDMSGKCIAVWPLDS